MQGVKVMVRATGTLKVEEGVCIFSFVFILAFTRNWVVRLWLKHFPGLGDEETTKFAYALVLATLIGIIYFIWKWKKRVQGKS
jgi:hypothetical protein